MEIRVGGRGRGEMGMGISWRWVAEKFSRQICVVKALDSRFEFQWHSLPTPRSERGGLGVYSPSKKMTNRGPVCCRLGRVIKDPTVPGEKVS